MSRDEVEGLRLWDCGDVAAALKLSRRTVQRLAAEGSLPCIYVGKSIRFDPNEVAAFLKASRPSRGG